MRLSVLSLALLIATCPAHGQRRERNNTDAVSRACTVEDCFREADVRDFEVIDRTHLIVYVGSQRCAFRLELSGALCDLSFAPELYFRRTNEVPQIVLARRPSGTMDAEPDRTVPRVGSRPGNFDGFEIEERERKDALICANDLMIQVHGGRWTETAGSSMGTDRFGNPRTDCRVSSVAPITDDQLLEFYVKRRIVSPVPPMGTGQIEVGEQEERRASPPPTETSSTQRRRRNSGD